MDYFFAQVELRDKPELQDKPVAIGGLVNGRGVLSTCNYVARKFGVRSALPTMKALKLCPNLILLPHNLYKYREASEIIFKIFREFTNKVQSISLDEAFLDVTECKLFNNDAVAIAIEIKRRIFEETELTASAGVSYNKLLAKIGSDLFKPNGISVLRPKNIMQNIAHFHVKKISGVGKVMELRMKKFGIITFGDLQRFSKLGLINMFGDFGATLHSYCRGIDERKVEERGERKSLSVENTFFEDIHKLDELLVKLEVAFVEMNRRRTKYKEDRAIKNIFVKVKYSDFTATTVEAQNLPEFKNYIELLKKRFQESDEKGVRLIGVGIKFHSSQIYGQLEMEF